MQNKTKKNGKHNEICTITFSSLLLRTVRTRDTERNSQYLATSEEMSSSTRGPRQYSNYTTQSHKSNEHRYVS